MIVDQNRDGKIDDADRWALASTGPFRFWINDDKDDGDIAAGDSDVPGAADGNHTDSVVNGRCDLIDFFPVMLPLGDVLQRLPVADGYTYKLSHASDGVSFAYTDLTGERAFDYLTTLSTSGYGSSFDRGAHAADTIQVPAAGVALSAGFLNRIQTGGQGIILVEGRWASISANETLNLEIWKDGNKLADLPLKLSLSSVESMFRHLNLTAMAGVPQTGPADRLSDADAPNEPPTGDKNFVFVHGYNVNPEKARAWESDFFKRLYWSGSKAKYWGVTWHGNESQVNVFGNDLTPNYHTNVVNAFYTAPSLKDFLAGLTGETALAGHSLGNMVCLSAISDWNAAPARYFMIDAAVPIEAIDGSLDTQTSMVHPEWLDYTDRLWAGKWFQLFSSVDHRNTLSWNNRLANFGSVNVYNFYSSGEEVLREDPDPPPAGLLDTLYQNVLNYYAGKAGVFAWVWQEKTKGRMAFNGVSGSDHGGWGFNSYYNTCPNSICGPRPPEQAALLTYVELQTNPFFDLGNYTLSSDHRDYVHLPGTDGSSYADAHRNRILADAIPALTLPIGANPVSRLAPQGQPDRNFNMNDAQYRPLGWPRTDDQAKWHHSDIRDVAYPFNHPVFDQLVNLGNLK